jgi:hypothetical protein
MGVSPTLKMVRGMHVGGSATTAGRGQRHWQWRGGPAGGSDVLDPALVSSADEEDAPPPLTADSALHMRLDKANMNLTTAVLAALSRPRTLPSIDNPTIRRPCPPPPSTRGAAAPPPLPAVAAPLPLPPSSSSPPRRRHRTSSPFFLAATAISPAAEHETMRQVSNESRASSYASHPTWTSPVL